MTGNDSTPGTQPTMEFSDLSIPSDATISDKDWIDPYTLASPECGIEFVLA